MSYEEHPSPLHEPKRRRSTEAGRPTRPAEQDGAGQYMRATTSWPIPPSDGVDQEDENEENEENEENGGNEEDGTLAPPGCFSHAGQISPLMRATLAYYSPTALPVADLAPGRPGNGKRAPLAEISGASPNPVRPGHNASGSASPAPLTDLSPKSPSPPASFCRSGDLPWPSSLKQLGTHPNHVVSYAEDVQLGNRKPLPLARNTQENGSCYSAAMRNTQRAHSSELQDGLFGRPLKQFIDADWTDVWAPDELAKLFAEVLEFKPHLTKKPGAVYNRWKKVTCALGARPSSRGLLAAKCWHQYAIAMCDYKATDPDDNGQPTSGVGAFAEKGYSPDTIALLCSLKADEDHFV